MRFALPTLAAACSLLPVAAMAQDVDAHRMADKLHDPATQEQISRAAEVMTDAVLGMPAGPLMRAMAEANGRDPEAVDPDLRVGDLIGPDAADARDEFAHRLPQMMGALAGLAAAFEDMLPELRDRIEDAREGASTH
ncbi:MAG: hypothetical protein ABIT16_11895 [Croceibacterium sp.]